MILHNPFRVKQAAKKIDVLEEGAGAKPGPRETVADAMNLKPYEESGEIGGPEGEAKIDKPQAGEKSTAPKIKVERIERVEKMEWPIGVSEDSISPIDCGCKCEGKCTCKKEEPTNLEIESRRRILDTPFSEDHKAGITPEQQKIVDDFFAKKTEGEAPSDDIYASLMTLVIKKAGITPEQQKIVDDFFAKKNQEPQEIVDEDVYASVLSIIKKEAVGTVESTVDQALEYFQQATKKPEYLDRVWKWIEGLRGKMGPDFNKFLSALKQKGSSLLTQLGVMDQLGTIGSAGKGTTTYAESQNDYQKIAEALSPSQSKDSVGDMSAGGTQVLQHGTQEEPAVSENEIQTIMKEFTEDLKKDQK